MQRLNKKKTTKKKQKRKNNGIIEWDWTDFQVSKIVSGRKNEWKKHFLYMVNKHFGWNQLQICDKEGIFLVSEESCVLSTRISDDTLWYDTLLQTEMQ